MATTNTQRELIDFLWDWTNPLGSWSKLLVELIANKQAELDQNERQRIFDYFLQDIGFSHTTPLPPLNITKPSFTPPSKEVALTKLSEVKGVNRLAENQIMDFSPNITIVYGNNGVGKTGYSRVLKSQGYSFDSNINILSNVHEDQVGQNAKIEFISDGNTYELNWDGGRPESDLNAVSIFNSDCVNISFCNNGIGNKNENEVAAEGYDYLRTSLELLVSKKIFQDVVDRYRPNLKMTLFPAVKGDKIEEHKAEIDTMFGRASGFIRAHSHPEEQHAPPTINELKADFVRFKAIESDFK